MENIWWVKGSCFLLSRGKEESFNFEKKKAKEKKTNGTSGGEQNRIYCFREFVVWRAVTQSKGNTEIGSDTQQNFEGPACKERGPVGKEVPNIRRLVTFGEEKRSKW